ncbi:hypothetical protein [Halorussus amylolyticus]|uniref:hypothetical protein n=1 Tax=Halorussus amylolyticus TaxID=1126242 RepID=UPI00104BAA9C|nr:hypothetical protein [Halorussus amylolyticus]
MEDTTVDRGQESHALDHEDDFGPTAAPSDEFFAVVDREVLAALADVFSHVGPNALLFVEASEGLKARGMSKHCYWPYVDIPVDSFQVFQTEGVKLGLDTDALASALDTTDPGERVALHYSPTAGFELDTGRERFDIDGERPPFDDSDDQRESILETYWTYKHVDFVIPSGRLEALVNLIRPHQHVLIESDLDTECVTFTFVDAPDDRPQLEFEATPDDLVESPFLPHWNNSIAPESKICTESLAPAIEPMRGPVTVHHNGMFGVPTMFEYTRANGRVSVVASIMHKIGE